MFKASRGTIFTLEGGRQEASILWSRSRLEEASAPKHAEF